MTAADLAKRRELIPVAIIAVNRAQGLPDTALPTDIELVLEHLDNLCIEKGLLARNPSQLSRQDRKEIEDVLKSKGILPNKAGVVELFTSPEGTIGSIKVKYA